MLTENERRIRDVVRFDSELASRGELAGVVDLAEKYSSALACQPGLSVEGYLMSRVAESAQNGTEGKKAGRIVKPQRGAKQTLSNHLASAHIEALDDHSPVGDRSEAAREAARTRFTMLGLSTNPPPPISMLFATHRAVYVEVAQRRDDLEHFMGVAVDHSIDAAERLVRDAQQIRDSWISQLEPKSGTVLDIAIRRLAVLPVMTSEMLINITGANKSNVFRALDELESIEAVAEASGRKKNRVWVAPNVIEALAQSIRRIQRVRLDAEPRAD